MRMSKSEGNTDRLSETHQAIEWYLVAGEVNRLLQSNTESMRLQAQPSHSDIICHNVTSDGTAPIRDLESLVGIYETRRAFRTKENMVTLV